MAPLDRETDCVTLVGMPGSGKSTVGVLLAKRLALGFVDTDVELQRRLGTTLQDYLETHGVDALRQAEGEVVAALPLEHHVVATGGSVVYGADAMARLGDAGPVVYLAVGLGTMIARLGDFSRRGIAMLPGTDLADMYAEREPLYRAAADFVVAAEQPAEAVCDEIERLLR